MSLISMEVPSVALKKWTPLAIDCYKKGCRCSLCNVKDNLSAEDNNEILRIYKENVCDDK